MQGQNRRHAPKSVTPVFSLQGKELESLWGKMKGRGFLRSLNPDAVYDPNPGPRGRETFRQEGKKTFRQEG